MKFLNRKEEVIQIELTQYGKYLLSRGVFQPTYYAFFDDDIVYDSQYMSTGSTPAMENSTRASVRIREAIRPSIQTSFSGVDRTFKEISQVKNVFDPILDKVVQIELSQEQKLEEVSKAPTSVDNFYCLALPMGTSEYNSDKLPAWDLKLANGEITGSVLNYTGSSGLLKIPQINVQAFYDTEVKQLVEENTVKNIKNNATIFEDGTYIDIKKDCILIDFKEHNSLFENENFEIEVYEVVEEPGDNKINENLVPLYFLNAEKVNKDVYYSKNNRKKIEVTEENVEYYFDIRVDEEITDDVGIKSGIITDLYRNVPKNDEEPC
jgi:hypothetical protein